MEKNYKVLHSKSLYALLEKKMKRILIVIACFFLNIYGTLFADNLDLHIRFWNTEVYYAQMAEQEVEVLVTITNNSPETQRFKLADDRSFSIDFEVYSMDNQLVAPSKALRTKRLAHRPLYFRELSLESMESYSFRENLRDYVDLDKSGAYIVRARLYTELYRPEEPKTPSPQTKISRGEELVSNRLSLSLRAKPILDENLSPLIALDEKTHAILERKQVPPDEVVVYMLNARIKSEWEKFFLYLDLEAMLTRDAKRRRTWLSEAEEGRQKMIAQYREDLMKNKVDGEISTIPIDYRIINTRYSPSEGEVKVLQKFRDGVYISTKEYIYSLKKRDNIWLISGYSVINVGTE